MPALSPSAWARRLAEADADVLDGVVGVDVQVALGLDGEVDQAVPGEQVSMWSKKPTPVSTRPAPVPSRLSGELDLVSAVSRWTCAARDMAGSFTPARGGPLVVEGSAQPIEEVRAGRGGWNHWNLSWTNGRVLPPPSRLARKLPSANGSRADELSTAVAAFGMVMAEPRCDRSR